MSRRPPRPDTGCTVTLPRRLMAQLLVHCGASGEQPADVVADALALHLDELGDRFDECDQAWHVPDARAGIFVSPASNGAATLPRLRLGQHRPVSGDPPRRPEAAEPPSAPGGAAHYAGASRTTLDDAPGSDRTAAVKVGAATGPAPPASGAPPPSEQLEIPAFLRRAP